VFLHAIVEEEILLGIEMSLCPPGKLLSEKTAIIAVS